QLLQGVTDQPTYTAALQHAQNLGIVKPGELPAVYDPQLVARLHANTLTQQQTLQNAQAAQAEATLANTQSYQKAELGLRAQQVGIEGANARLQRDKFNIEEGTGGPG